MQVHLETIPGYEGERLYTAYYPAPALSARGTVLWVHGYAEHSGRYLPLIQYLLELGWHSIAWDLRGHGRSTGRRGYVSDLEEYLADLTAVWTHWHPRVPQPIVLFGHSLGGLIVLRYRQKYAALWKPRLTVVSAPLIQLKVKVPAYKRILGELAARFLPTLSLPSGLKPTDLTHDPAEAQAYANDPLVFKIATAGWFAAIQRAQADLWKDLPRLTDEAFLFLIPEKDPVCDSQATHHFFDHLPTPHKHLLAYPESYHEPLHETFREKVFQDIANFLQSL
jgi:alpha-beta hydrolase superfamily lysophospholipase